MDRWRDEGKEGLTDGQIKGWTDRGKGRKRDGQMKRRMDG